MRPVSTRAVPQPVPEHRRPQRRALYACDEALRLIAAYEEPDAPAVAGRAAGRHRASASPRRRAGLLYHRYELDDEGTILDAKIVPPTSQNQLAIEDDLRAVVGRYATLGRRGAAGALRADDPQLRPVHLVRNALSVARGRAPCDRNRRDRRGQRVPR